MNLSNEEIFEQTENLEEFWKMGGTWAMSEYVDELIKQGYAS